MKAVILAGGKGTRLGSLTSEIPKPLVEINGKSILEHQLDYLKKEKFTDVIVLTGHLGQKIHEFLGDGSAFGLKIECLQETTPLGTAGCLAAIKDRLKSDFLLLYGDVILDINIHGLTKFHQNHGAVATLVVHPNDHPDDSDLVIADKDGKINAFISKKEHGGNFLDNLVNAAMYVLSPDVLDYIALEKCDFIRDIFPKVLKDQKSIFAYNTTEYIKDVGTPERIKQVGRHLKSGLVAQRNLINPQKAFFLDRDGTINEEIGLLSDVKNLKLIPGSENAIKKINQSGFLAVCVTNQPVIARNLCDFKDLANIHKKLATLLGAGNAYLDRLYFCPHHPDKDYPEERPEYKIKCTCRKPEIGMIKQAALDMNIDLSQSYIIGDRTVDIETGHRAGVKSILVKTGAGGKDGKFNSTPDYCFNNLEAAIDSIIGKK
jgi:mannose-1-phosphate guanylyltransferase / phosphomannomutase